MLYAILIFLFFVYDFELIIKWHRLSDEKKHIFMNIARDTALFPLKQRELKQTRVEL